MLAKNNSYVTSQLVIPLCTCGHPAQVISAHKVEETAKIKGVTLDLSGHKDNGDDAGFEK